MGKEAGSIPRFECCGISFEGEQAYVEHRQKIHGEQLSVRYTCCGIRFYTDEGYSAHRQAVHGDSSVPRQRGFLARLLRRA
ncbi:MAG: hypothetical protein HYX92_09485 [Chloroflexi bacterium]|nr:hypothetical protein [Chloroflexota bacterium]